MTVYVESNFVLEIALGQEQAEPAEAILERAERGEIALAMPSFALSEPFSTVTQRDRRRRRLAVQLRDELRDLGRSWPHQEDVDALEPSVSMLAQIGKREIDRLGSTVGRLLDVARMIQLDAAVYREAVQYMRRYDLSGQDAIIYTAVLHHLRTDAVSGRHLFITRNWRDFADPDLTAMLEERGCDLVRSFVEGILRLEQAPFSR